MMRGVPQKELGCKTMDLQTVVPNDFLRHTHHDQTLSFPSIHYAPWASDTEGAEDCGDVRQTKA
jgi:hypothetical protein